VLVTCGGDGAVVVTPAGELVIHSPRVEVVNTIGAGDAFSAGFLAWWRHHGMSRDQLSNLEAAVDATRFACLLASRACEQAGASPPDVPAVT
jgi:fructokinase